MPSVTFGAAQSFGPLAGWYEESSRVTVASQRSRAMDNVGNEAFSKLFDERTDVQTPYTAYAIAAPTVPATLGALVNSLLLTGIDLNTQAGEPVKMSLEGHNHTANAHTGTERTVEHGVTLSAGWGACDFLGSTSGANATLQSSSIRIRCQHVDEIGSAGDHFIGQNTDAMLEVTQDWIGVPSAYQSGTDWDITSVETPTDAQGFKHTVVQATKKLTLSAP